MAYARGSGNDWARCSEGRGGSPSTDVPGCLGRITAGGWTARREEGVFVVPASGEQARDSAASEAITQGATKWKEKLNEQKKANDN